MDNNFLNLVKITTMRYSRSFLLFVFILMISFTAVNNNLQAQSSKKTLTIEDVELWRNHSVTLSDNGNWYTVLYSLTEKPEPDKNGEKINKEKMDSVDIYIYGKESRTDILYIYSTKKGLKYEIPSGSNPVFSSSSEWIAYTMEPEDKGNAGKEKESNTIELRNLETGDTRQYQSNASYYFPEDKDLFLTSDNNSLLIYDLNRLSEYYIGNIGEYLADKKSDYIVYTIASEDKRGNGIYLYDPVNLTTKALVSGNNIYSNLAWNADLTSLAALSYNLKKEKADYKNMNIILISGIDKGVPAKSEIIVEDLKGMPELMGPATRSGQLTHPIVWSQNSDRLFIKIKEYKDEAESDNKETMSTDESATVDVWHWKDEKLLSQRMLEEERNSSKVYDAVISLRSKSIIRLSNDEIQSLTISKGTDRWAIGRDNRKYISDWDVSKSDLYRINLNNGDKKLIIENYAGSFELSPDGSKMILWHANDFWCYDLDKDLMKNISKGMDVSFVNDEHDRFGSTPNYGFAGWLKGRDAMVVNHKYDLWILPFNDKAPAENITASVRKDENIQFRFDDLSFTREEEPDERYIDLSQPVILSAFNTKTKYSGYYKIENMKLKKLLFGPASYGASRWRSGITRAEKSDVIIYKKGDYINYPESYLSDINFSGSKKITNTNPQQKEYKWGDRILFDYTNDDGVELQGILSIPESYTEGQKLPMLIYSYEKVSQGMYQYPTPTIGGARLCEMMYVSDGYLYMQPDIHFNIGTPHSDMHESIDAAIRKVIELGYVDEDRIGYEGFSYGGHCGMYISTQENRFAAIAAGAGVSNLVQGFTIDIVGDGSNEQDYYMTGQGRLGTDPTSDTEMYITESPVFNAAGMNTPLLLFHGTADNVVQWEHSFGFYSILRYLKKPVVFLSYQGEGHGLRKKANRLDIQNRLKEYFDHYLKGEEAGKWMKEEIPYESKKEDKSKEKDKESNRRPVPLWK